MIGFLHPGGQEHMFSRFPKCINLNFQLRGIARFRVSGFWIARFPESRLPTFPDSSKAHYVWDCVISKIIQRPFLVRELARFRKSPNGCFWIRLRSVFVGCTIPEINQRKFLGISETHFRKSATRTSGEDGFMIFLYKPQFSLWKNAF